MFIICGKMIPGSYNLKWKREAKIEDCVDFGKKRKWKKNWEGIKLGALLSLHVSPVL